MHRYREIIPGIYISRDSAVTAFITTAFVEIKVNLYIAPSFDLDVDFLSDGPHSYSMNDLLVMVVATERDLYLSLEDTPYFITGPVWLFWDLMGQEKSINNRQS